MQCVVIQLIGVMFVLDLEVVGLMGIEKDDYVGFVVIVWCVVLNFYWLEFVGVDVCIVGFGFVSQYLYFEMIVVYCVEEFLSMLCFLFLGFVLCIIFGDIVDCFLEVIEDCVLVGFGLCFVQFFLFFFGEQRIEFGGQFFDWLVVLSKCQ